MDKWFRTNSKVLWPKGSPPPADFDMEAWLRAHGHRAGVAVQTRDAASGRAGLVQVAIEDHGYALTQLSIFEDRQLANRLLGNCELSGRRLHAILKLESSDGTLTSAATSDEISHLVSAGGLNTKTQSVLLTVLSSLQILAAVPQSQR